MTPPITPITVPLVLADDSIPVGSLVTVGTAEFNALSVFVVNIVTNSVVVNIDVKSMVVSVVVNPAVVDMPVVGHEFLSSSGNFNNY